MAETKVEAMMGSLPQLLSISQTVWIDYDEEADVLYLSFRKPQRATDSLAEDNVVYHYDGEQLVGITVIGFKALSANVGELSADRG